MKKKKPLEDTHHLISSVPIFLCFLWQYSKRKVWSSGKQYIYISRNYFVLDSSQLRFHPLRLSRRADITWHCTGWENILTSHEDPSCPEHISWDDIVSRPWVWHHNCVLWRPWWLTMTSPMTHYDVTYGRTYSVLNKIFLKFDNWWGKRMTRCQYKYCRVPPTQGLQVTVESSQLREDRVLAEASNLLGWLHFYQK